MLKHLLRIVLARHVILAQPTSAQIAKTQDYPHQILPLDTIHGELQTQRIGGMETSSQRTYSALQGATI
jgi:hypothetical protein